MKTIVGLIFSIIIVGGCTTAKKANKAEPIPSGQMEVPQVLNHNTELEPQFCITLNPNFTYIAYTTSIFNRWGEKIWSADDPETCWNGKIVTKGVAAIAPEGVYAVVIEIEATNGKRYRTNSTLTVLH